MPNVWDSSARGAKSAEMQPSLRANPLTGQSTPDSHQRFADNCPAKNELPAERSGQASKRSKCAQEINQVNESAEKRIQARLVGTYVVNPPPLEDFGTTDDNFRLRRDSGVE